MGINNFLALDLVVMLAVSRGTVGRLLVFY